MMKICIQGRLRSACTSMQSDQIHPFLHIYNHRYRNYGKSSKYRISSVIRRIIFLPKQSQRSRSVLKEGSRSLASFEKGKICIIAKFHRTDLVI